MNNLRTELERVTGSDRLARRVLHTLSNRVMEMGSHLDETGKYLLHVTEDDWDAIWAATSDFGSTWDFDNMEEKDVSKRKIWCVSISCKAGDCPPQNEVLGYYPHYQGAKDALDMWVRGKGNVEETDADYAEIHGGEVEWGFGTAVYRGWFEQKPGWFLREDERTKDEVDNGG